MRSREASKNQVDKKTLPKADFDSSLLKVVITSGFPMKTYLSDTGKAKKCNICNEIKPLHEYYKHLSSRGGRIPKCRACVKSKTTSYYRTQKGVVTRMYIGQRNNSKKRGHPAPGYTKAELREWLYINGFYAMWCQWHWSNFDKYMKPSPDRKDSLKPYSLGNLQLITWRENNRLGTKDTKNGFGRSGNRCKPVVQIDPATHLVIASFISYKAAGMKTGVCAASISRSINNGRKTAGYLWRSKNA